MSTVLLSAKRSLRRPAFSLQRRTFFCLLVLFVLDARSPVQGQILWSPCPNVFTNVFSAGSNQWVGYVQLPGIRIGQLIKLNVDLSISIPVVQNNIGSIALAQSNEKTFLDIENNRPVFYRIDVQLKNIIPSLLAISVNDQTICTGLNVTYQAVTTINLEYTLFTQTLPLADGTGYGNNDASIIQPQPPQTPAPPPQVMAQSPARPSMNDNSEKEQIECGTPAKIFNRLALNGYRSPKGQFPWATPIFETTTSSEPKFIGGSTIITTTHLVTVASSLHDKNGVVRNPNELLAVPGMYNLANFNDYGLQTRNVVHIFIHDEFIFEEVPSDSDIAVLKVDQPIVYDNLVRPICLWPATNELERIVGLNGFVTGWGHTENGDANYPSYVTATIVDLLACEQNLEMVLTNSSRLFCADGHGTVPCTGDSGNGLVIRRDSQYFLRGIVSVGQFDTNTLTCSLRKYVVYTDIAPFRYWLVKAIRA